MVLGNSQGFNSTGMSFAERLTQLFWRSFDLEYGTIVVPSVFKKVLGGTELPFQTIASDLAQDLVIQRQDTQVGQKFLVFAEFSEWNNDCDQTRQEFRRFFIEQLGFTE